MHQLREISGTKVNTFYRNLNVKYLLPLAPCDIDFTVMNVCRGKIFTSLKL